MIDRDRYNKEGRLLLKSDYMRTNIVSAGAHFNSCTDVTGYEYHVTSCSSDCVQESIYPPVPHPLASFYSRLVLQFIWHGRFWVFAFKMLLVGLRIRHLRLAHTALPRERCLSCLLLIRAPCFGKLFRFLLSFLL